MCAFSLGSQSSQASSSYETNFGRDIKFEKDIVEKNWADPVWGFCNKLCDLFYTPTKYITCWS